VASSAAQWRQLGGMLLSGGGGKSRENETARVAAESAARCAAIENALEISAGGVDLSEENINRGAAWLRSLAWRRLMA